MSKSWRRICCQSISSRILWYVGEIVIRNFRNMIYLQATLLNWWHLDWRFCFKVESVRSFIVVQLSIKYKALNCTLLLVIAVPRQSGSCSLNQLDVALRDAINYNFDGALKLILEGCTLVVLVHELFHLDLSLSFLPLLSLRPLNQLEEFLFLFSHDLLDLIVDCRLVILDMPFGHNVNTGAILQLIVLMPLRRECASMSSATHWDSLDWLLVGTERASCFLSRKVALSSILA